MESTPAIGTQTLHPNNEQNTVPVLSYTDAEKKYKAFKRNRMIAARDVRDASRHETDDIPFLKWYDILKKADDQYVAPRKNIVDTSINLGTVRDKDTSLLEYACKYDFEPVAQIFDEDDQMLEEVADSIEDMVKKSKQIEEYKTKAKLIYRSMIAFGTALVEDPWVEQWTMEKTMKAGFKQGMGSDKAEWEEKMVKSFEGCTAKLWDLRKCYFGDIRKFFMNGPEGQPYFFTVEYESYDVVKSKFGNWDRFKYVPTTVVGTNDLSSTQGWTDFWTLRPITLNYCELIRYYDPVANEFAFTINDVEMLPLMSKKKKGTDGIEKEYISGFPLTEVSPSGVINFAKFDLEPMHESAYSKPQPAKMRVLADVENMLMKLNLGMIKQKAKPTMGNKSGKNFGPEATEPGQVINDIREGDLFPVLPNFEGPTNADFSFFELVQKQLDKNSVERSFQGIDNQPQNETATADMNDFKAQALKVASMFDGIISGENQLSWLRTYNLIEHWTKPIDVQIDVVKKSLVNRYRTITVSTEVDGGQKATKKINFTKNTPVRPNGKSTLEDSMKKHQEELDHQKETGKEVRTVDINPEVLRSMKLSMFYTCIPVPNGADPLAYMMFSKQIFDAQKMFGPDSLNVKKLKHKFASMTGQDFDTWFISEQELQQKQQQAAQAAQTGGAADQSGGAPTDVNIAKSANPMAKMGAVMR